MSFPPIHNELLKGDIGFCSKAMLAFKDCLSTFGFKFCSLHKYHCYIIKVGDTGATHRLVEKAVDSNQT